MTQVVKVRDGVEITAAQAIIEAVRVGSYLEPAIRAAKVGKSTVYGWLDVAARARARTIAADHLTNPTERAKAKRLTKHEQRCIEFSDAVEEAQGEWEVAQHTLLERLARGGTVLTSTTVKVEVVRDAQGQIVVGEDGKPVERELERSTKREVLGPDPRVIQWRLERMHPDRYGRRVAVFAGDDPGRGEVSEDDRVDRLLAEAEAFMEGAAVAIDVESREGPRG